MSVTSPYTLLVTSAFLVPCGTNTASDLPLCFLIFLLLCLLCCCCCRLAGIQEGTECTKCKNDWALRAAIALLYVLCALLTIAVAVLGYKGESQIVKIVIVNHFQPLVDLNE